MRTVDRSWLEIKTQNDAELFMKYKGSVMDDDITTLVSLSWENNDLLMMLDTYLGRLEMLFEGVLHFSFSGQNGGCVSSLCGFSLEVRNDLLGRTRDDNLVVWTDGYKLQYRSGYIDLRNDSSSIIARRLKYRFAEKEMTAPYPEQRLKEIVEENYLIEITWGEFFKNLDNYISSDEAKGYGITQRKFVKPYFNSYSLKYFPDSGNPLIIMEIKFDSAENMKYLGRYELTFNMDLEITDDFFVIEREV